MRATRNVQTWWNADIAQRRFALPNDPLATSTPRPIGHRIANGYQAQKLVADAAGCLPETAVDTPIMLIKRLHRVAVLHVPRSKFPFVDQSVGEKIERVMAVIPRDPQKRRLNAGAWPFECLYEALTVRPQQARDPVKRVVVPRGEQDR
jgi:hypothetical protein